MSIFDRLGFRAVSALLRFRGYEAKELGFPPRGQERFLQFARRCGIAPATVFDIGVGEGTPWLYDAFPGAKLVLIEALENFRPNVEDIASRFQAEFHFTALGRAPGKMSMRVPHIEAQGASLYGRADAFSKLESTASRTIDDDLTEVAVATLDSIATHAGPYVVKIDVEGAELDVLAGGTATLRRTDLVILEMSVLKRFTGEPSFAERIAFLDQAGFELFDIPELSQTSADGPLSFIDAAFIRKDSKLTIHQW